MAIDTGLGATLTAMPGSWTGSLVSYKLHTTTLPLVDISHLGTTTFRDKMAGDLAEPGVVELTVQFSHTVAPPVVGDAGTLTLTDAVPSGGTTAANYSGTAIVTNVDHGERTIDGLNQLIVEVSWDGVTGPTFTAGT